MPKTQKELYAEALSKMAIPNCQCLLDDTDNSSRNINKTENPNDTNRTTRTRDIQAQTQNKIP